MIFEASDLISHLALHVLTTNTVDQDQPPVMFAVHGTADRPSLGCKASMADCALEELAAILPIAASDMRDHAGRCPAHPGPLTGFGLRLETRAICTGHDDRLGCPGMHDVGIVWVATRWRGFWWVELEHDTGKIFRRPFTPDNLTEIPREIADTLTRCALQL
ncbi:hypothetical protein AWN90_09220 [Nocardia terpenica]|uniref:Uncharacterized protein n=1 Tax=Nocardia terpenica TaxID=455432 RepID=A0A164H118_9NOCA|nr:hypothetical protein AWN90_09220 [Nocardia terpenica]